MSRPWRWKETGKFKEQKENLIVNQREKNQMRKMEVEAMSQSCLEVIAKMLILFFAGQQRTHNKVLSALSLSLSVFLFLFLSLSLCVLEHSGCVGNEIQGDQSREPFNNLGDKCWWPNRSRKTVRNAEIWIYFRVLSESKFVHKLHFGMEEESRWFLVILITVTKPLPVTFPRVE